MSIEITDLSFSYEKHQVLHNIDFSAHDGDLVAVLGPNGVGKSTLFRCMLGFLKPQSGEIIINGHNIRDMDSRAVAREIAYIPQSVSPAFNYTVQDTVLMGLTNQLGTFRSPKKEHVERVLSILDSLGIAHLRHRGCARISGGERQLTLLARALIQNAKVLIMDEPTANLDYGNQYRVMERIGSLADKGYTIIFSTHDPNQALLHTSRALVLSDGHVLASGPSKDVLTEDVLSSLYGIDVSIHDLNYGDSRCMVCTPSAAAS
ncbi:MAG: ABC transporter ATP-binding protein [Oscillospiraceae bacterium]|nr:ABC transporter ATP-binding protein [Oscillospiraceae bacterium]